VLLFGNIKQGNTTHPEVFLVIICCIIQAFFCSWLVQKIRDYQRTKCNSNDTSTQKTNIENENSVNEERDHQQTDLSPLDLNCTAVKKWTKKKKFIVFSILIVASLITTFVVLYTCNRSFERLIKVYCFNDCRDTISLANHYAESDWKKSLSLYERAIELAEHNGNDFDLTIAYSRYAKMLLKQKEYSFAIYICERAHEHLKRKIFYDIMGEAYEGQKNYASAYECYKQDYLVADVLREEHKLLTKEERNSNSRVNNDFFNLNRKIRPDDSIIFKLALWHTYGQGCEKDLAKAANLWTYLANQNNYSAMYNLGLCYWRGEGVVPNDNTAFKLFKEAADNGNKNAMKSLSTCYELGLGCNMDKSAANYWKDLAEK
jgi:TPR repeat protein